MRSYVHAEELDVAIGLSSVANLLSFYPNGAAIYRYLTLKRIAISELAETWHELAILSKLHQSRPEIYYKNLKSVQ